MASREAFVSRGATADFEGRPGRDAVKPGAEMLKVWGKSGLRAWRGVPEKSALQSVGF